MADGTIEKIAKFFERINDELGLSIEFTYEIKKQGKFPITQRGGKLVIVPDFFDHKDISEEQRKMMIILLYSVLCLAKSRDFSPVNPEILARGICNVIGEKYIPEYKLEEAFIPIRMTLYDDVKYASRFNIGDELRIDIATRYRVVDIHRSGDSISIVVEPIGYNAKCNNELETFDENDLFERCCHFDDFTEYKVDLRQNLIILSAPSATGKNTVFNTVQELLPEVKRAITATTRSPRRNEINGVDYHFMSQDEFDKRSFNGEFAEQNHFDSGYYATPISEIEKYPETTPVFLIIDTHGRNRILHKYPLSTSIFLMPPSIEELENRIRNRGDNTLEEIQRRIETAKKEMKEAPYYDYVLVTDDVSVCADEIIRIIKAKIGSYPTGT